MTWPDWCIAVIPLLIVLAIGLKSQWYMKSLADGGITINGDLPKC